MKKVHLLLSLATALGPLSAAFAQQAYEFEVYGTQLTQPGTTEFELNTNFVASGQKQIVTGLFPTHHMVRSSLEIGTGLTSWLEGSIYLLTVHRPNDGVSYVGNRIRATASAPSKWGLPVELGVTQELGYGRPGFAEHRWTYELSPMIGKKWGSLAFVVNPALERGLGGVTEHPVEFEPRGKIGYSLEGEGSVSIEYYSSLGPTSRFEPRSEQRHQLFAAIEKEISARWDMAVSFGRGLTAASDRAVLATRLEYRIGR